MAIVLVFSDVAPLAFPYSAAQATKVVSSYGTTFAKDVVCNRTMLVQSKADNTASTVASYAYVQSSSGTLSEIARHSFSVDSSLTKGTYSLGCLRTNAGVSTIESAFEVDHTQFVVNSVSAADAAISTQTAITYSGISFGQDSASIYFGANKTFRLRFGAGEGNGSNVLAIESLNADGSYTTRASYNDSS